MGNVVASTIFCVRNADKVENGDLGRVPVAIGQARNVANSIMSFDNAVGRGAQTAVNAFNSAAKNEALFKYMGKAVNFVGDHINPLICVSSGIKVLNSDDKASAFVTQASALSGMFFVEGMMKKHLQEGIDKTFEKASALDEEKGAGKIAKRAVNFLEKHNLKGKLPKVLYGVTFVVGSCTGYNYGEKLGNAIVNDIKGGEGQKKGAYIA